MPAAASVDRHLPIGAEFRDGKTHFRLWAPKLKKVEVVFEKGLPPVELKSEGDSGYFSNFANVPAGTNYKFKIDGGDAFPDPASRCQPGGAHGYSQVVDPANFKWSDQKWKGVPAAGQVLYELHIGTFTPAGTWAAAAEKLQHLKDVGITCIEMMPVNEFAGEFGWGYDGVGQFSPYHGYGSPDDLKRFIDQAHGMGMGVIIDLVYNHLGPDGNYLPTYSDHYFSRKHATDWGEGLNYDAHGAEPVREYFISNTRYWIGQFHFDGIRFDATQAILDDTQPYILQAVTEAARKEAGNRSLYIINENEPQNNKLVMPIDQGGYGMDGLWNDDFHHAAMVAVSGRNEAYYHDYLGTPQEMLSCAKYGYLFQGTRCGWQSKRRGTTTRNLLPTAFVNFLQNHDQIANSGQGLRIHHLTSLQEYRAMTTFFLLMPQTPMLFMGQEFAASTPFFYFADFKGDLAEAVRAGRSRDLSQFPSVATPKMLEQLVVPHEPKTFEKAKLNWDDLKLPCHQAALDLHRDLLKLRREDPTIVHSQTHKSVDGAILGQDAFCLRYFDPNGEDDRLLVVNFHHDLRLDRPPEPLLAPPTDRRWAIQFNSEDPSYGGGGAAPPDTETEGWLIPARTALLLKPVSIEEGSVLSRIVTKGSAQAAKIIDESEDASPT